MTTRREKARRGVVAQEASCVTSTRAPMGGPLVLIRVQYSRRPIRSYLLRSVLGARRWRRRFTAPCRTARA